MEVWFNNIMSGKMFKRTAFLLIILFALSISSCFTYSSTGESCQACYGSGRCSNCSGTRHAREEGRCLICNGSGKCIYCAGTGRLVRGVWPVN